MMTAEVRARWVITHRAPCILVRGKDARDVLRKYGFKPLWSVNGRGWVLDDDRLPDVAAIAGMVTLGYRVVHEDGTQCGCVDLRAEHREVDGDPSELCTCGAGVIGAEQDLVVAQLGAVEIGHVHGTVS